MVILQIGANKGNTDNDSVYKMYCGQFPESHEWKMIFVEPNPHSKTFLELAYSSVKDKQIINMGVSDKEEILELWVDNDYDGNRCSQHGSFNKSHLYKMGHAEKDIVSYKVYCVTLNQLIKNLNLTKIDYLQVDTEGYDYKILKDLDTTLCDIQKIEYEHIHISSEERVDLIHRFNMKGYSMLSFNLESFILEKRCE